MILSEKPAFRLFFASAIALYTEVVIIRWLGSEIRMFAYLKNFSLLAAFLGLGMGMMGKGEKLKRFHIPVLCLFASLLVFSSKIGLTRLFFPDATIHQWGGSLGSPQLAGLIKSMPLVKPIAPFLSDAATLYLLGACALLVFVFLFALLLFVFIPFGHYMGAEMPRIKKPLTAYTINLIGSLIGTLGFTYLVSFYLNPFFWAVPIFLSLTLFFSDHKIRDTILSIGFLLIMAFSIIHTPEIHWSPYYRISLFQQQSDSYTLLVDHDGFQDVRDFSKPVVAREPDRLEASKYYNFPYLEAYQPENVLVLGAGTGNDVSAALRAQAHHVDAVEIDPLIYKIGTQIHPEKPYSNENVNVVINDARAFLNQAASKPKRYDRIVLGLVDSHAALSSLSSLRLEFYLYSQESFKQALSLLNPDHGLLVVGFGVSWKGWVAERIYQTLKSVSAYPPLVLKTSDYIGNLTFVAGPGIPALKEALKSHPEIQDVTAQYISENVRPVSDNWPFLYHNPKSFPTVYFGALLLILFSGIFILHHSKSTQGRNYSINLPMFLMGTGFLLIETRNIAQLSLLFGSTWIVNSVVFSGIFAMALFANAITAAGWHFKYKTLFFGLVIALTLNYFVPIHSLLSFNPVTRAIFGGGLSALPILFSSLIFSRMFEKTSHPENALASNMLGGLLGGLLEAFSVFTGIRFMLVIAALIYACVAIVLARSEKKLFLSH